MRPVSGWEENTVCRRLTLPAITLQPLQIVKVQLGLSTGMFTKDAIRNMCHATLRGQTVYIRMPLLAI